MIIFNSSTADSVWQQIAKELKVDVSKKEVNSRLGSTYELLHVGITINNPLQRWVVSRFPPMNPAFAIAEVVAIINGKNDSYFLNYWNSQLPKYAGFVDNYHGAYGFRLRKHFNHDQLDRAYKCLKANPSSRQVVLQIWDSEIDFPNIDGTPTAEDIPCNLVSLLKIRNNKLEWMQIVRSNDLLLGTPYNFVQFTYLQEILAGWLEIGIGSYNQISDSLHVYKDQLFKINEFIPVEPKMNTDSISMIKDLSETYFSELYFRMNLFIEEKLNKEQHLKNSLWTEAPKSFQNLLCIVSAEAARRRNWFDLTFNIIGNCNNPVLKQLWDRWIFRLLH